MTLRLLIDESSDSRDLRRLLTAAGVAFVLPSDGGLRGADDDVVFAYARANGLVLLTKNPDDFRELHTHSPGHAGILVVYKDNDRTRDMTDAEIVRAVINLLTAGVPIAGEVHVLNHWRY